MKLNVLVVGLTPNYFSSSVLNAVNDFQAEMRSTNMGASFITRSLMSIFDATYLDITTDYNIADLKNKYDVCVVSLASHLGPTRNVSILVNFLKKLDIRTVFLSGGLDAAQSGQDSVHKSIKELMDICSCDNQYIGVRGAASTLYLQRGGIKNVVPIGCPTMYSNYSGELSDPQICSKQDIAVPFHWSIASDLLSELRDHLLIGQDCIDEELFLNKDYKRISKNIARRLGTSVNQVQDKLSSSIADNVFFPDTYESWFKKIGSQNALLSGRLHAAICGLTQGVPTVLTSWDLRTREIIDYFKIPTVDSDEIRNKGSVQAFKKADFQSFNSRQSYCWARWKEFLNHNNLATNIVGAEHLIGNKVTMENVLENDLELFRTASLLQSYNERGRLGQLKPTLSAIKSKAKSLKSRVR